MQEPTQSRDNNFTFLRLVAASLVVVSHSYILTKSGEPLMAVTRFESFGGLAVATFFVISGYLVTASLIRSSTPLEYLKKRALRMYPAFVAAVLVTLLVIGPLVTSFGLGDYFSDPLTLAFLKNLTMYRLVGALPGVFTHNPYTPTVNDSLWTLPAEFTVYLVLLLLFILGSKKPAGLLAVALLLMAVNAGLAHLDAGVDARFYVLKLVRWSRYWSLFFVGSFMFTARGWIKLSYPWFFLALAASLSCVLFRGMPNAVYYLSLPYVIIYMAHLPVPFLGKLDRLGDISYGVYLYAFPVQQSVIYFSGGAIGPVRLIFFSLSLAMLLGTLSWILIEKPALRLKNQALLHN